MISIWGNNMPTSHVRGGGGVTGINDCASPACQLSPWLGGGGEGLLVEHMTVPPLHANSAPERGWGLASINDCTSPECQLSPGGGGG